MFFLLMMLLWLTLALAALLALAGLVLIIVSLVRRRSSAPSTVDSPAPPGRTAPRTDRLLWIGLILLGAGLILAALALFVIVGLNLYAFGRPIP